MTTNTVDGSQKAAAIRAAADAVHTALYSIADDAEGRTPEFLTPTEVARILRVTPQTIYDRVKAGRIPSQKVGRRVLIPADAVRELAS